MPVEDTILKYYGLTNCLNFKVEVDSRGVKLGVRNNFTLHQITCVTINLLWEKET